MREEKYYNFYSCYLIRTAFIIVEKVPISPASAKKAADKLLKKLLQTLCKCVILNKLGLGVLYYSPLAGKIASNQHNQSVSAAVVFVFLTQISFHC